MVRSTYLSKLDSPQASQKAWYMLADPRDLAAIEVVFLGGKEKPTIESTELDLNILGISMRGFHDWGVALQDDRAAIKMEGE